MKKSFILYTDMYEGVSCLSNEQAGQLFKNIFQYVRGEDLEDAEMQAMMAFSFIKPHLDRDLKKYEEEIRAKSEGGKKAAQKRWGTKNKIVKDTITKNKIVKDTITKNKIVKDRMHDNVNVNVNDNVNVKKKKNIKKERFIPSSSADSDGDKKLQSIVDDIYARKYPEGDERNSAGYKAFRAIVEASRR